MYYSVAQGCQMYTVRPCGHLLTDKLPCSYGTAITPKCVKRKCNNDWYAHTVEPESKIHKGKGFPVDFNFSFIILSNYNLYFDEEFTVITGPTLKYF